MNGEFMIIDDIPVEINGEKNILELVRKAGIDLPTFCYYSELSVYGACRMCMVENKWGDMEASCSTPPRAGMEIHTNTPRLRKYRKMNLELLLSNHCRDCTTCEKNGHCKLQDLSQRFGIKQVRFNNTSEERQIDNSSACIVRDKSKCILCGDCVRVCEEVQNIGAIDFVKRGSKMTVTTAFDEPIADSNCVGCGQCAAVCPTGAIVVKNDTARLWEDISDKDTKVVVQIAPAVRVGISQELGQKDGENVMGKIVSALRKMGFDEVFDTSTGADLTVLEETTEFLSRLEKNEKLPLFTSCCPAWVSYVENTYPSLMKNVSTCRSPMQMFSSVLKEHYKHSNKRVVSVAIMPCTAKKSEAKRDEFAEDGVSSVDYVITTQELIQMIKESGIVFSEVEPEAVDMPFGVSSGAGVIFGVTGGVTEAVIRRVLDDKSTSTLRALAFNGVRGMAGVKETSITVDNRVINIAVVSGLKNADELIKRIQSGAAHYDFIEVMACPGGCISGAGQPFAKAEGKLKRGAGLYEADRMSSIKRSEENPVMMSLYQGILKGKVHKLLHVDYKGKE
ncbi:[FeFe] hydrogenase, group A [Clostridium tagluense]|uniref:[FeFe] hydrogenase, group A n=1 Tax=Clostridium tagluense TaxID=360422 RepID=UPI001C0AB9C9|nr:[FeFe] hydrogenase, group A [Clostridium tagluense]MBU3129367.1 [FeFe] hydrogenase, group A [Clostridium tagluense]MCB2310730.1 [FeFe] hydrogenase, group A [Clostridium tagluense]MCB2315540.1 [FeFe] hydrogenase, group A [Clostridium tagluense]MCB2320394.1 [FeFe] hydrogenase, group A [Clostridium tagluense]MCB2325323.1 [FeFe] hydrogenase, group A [Clostridium tagluense]